MQERDARDQGRSISPTKPATDALIIDTSDLTADQVFERALAFIASQDEGVTHASANPFVQPRYQDRRIQPVGRNSNERTLLVWLSQP